MPPLPPNRIHNPWQSSRALTDAAESNGEDLDAPALIPHKQLLAIRVLVAVILGIPGTLLAPFAAWLVVASSWQIVLKTTPLAIPVLVISQLALVGLLCLWWFVIFGLQPGMLKIVQIGGVAMGSAILVLVIVIQFSAFFH